MRFFRVIKKKPRKHWKAHDLIYIKEVIFGGGIPMGLTTFLLAISAEQFAAKSKFADDALNEKSLHGSLAL